MSNGPIYVAPTATGTGSGSSASNALSIKSLDKAIQLAGPGGTVILLSDHGAYNITSTINLSHGGTDGASVTIVGEDSSGHASNIVINGTRAATYTPGMSAGDTIFRLTTGANDLNFQHITFNNVGMAFLAASDVHDISIRDMTANNVQYFMSDYASVSGGTASVSNLTVDNVDVHGFSKGVIRLQYDSHDIAISNVFGDSEHEDGDGIAMGIHFDGTAHNITVTGSTMENAIASSSTYYNGDGFTAEAGVYNLTFQNDLSLGNADAGFDIKATQTQLIDCTADGNGRNYRLWSDITLTDCTGLDPHKQGGTTGGQEQIQVLHGSTVTVNGGAFSDSGSSSKVVLFDAGGTITFNGTQIVHATGASLHSGTGNFVDSGVVETVDATGTYSTNGASLLSQPAPVPVPVVAAPTDLTLSANSVAENAANGTSVGFATVPPGSGATGVTYSLTGNVGGAFAINAQTGEITVANGSLINFESSASMSLTVQASDSAGSYHESFTIAVQDVNEAPIGATFTGGTIPENSAAGTLVGTVHGVDPDSGDTLTYALSDNAGGRFLIDAHSGAVTVATGAVLDYETQSQFAIKAVVTDSHGLTYTAPLTVMLTDVAETTTPGNSHKVFHFAGDERTAIVSGDVLTAASVAKPTPVGTTGATTTTPATSSSTVHVYGAAGIGYAGAYEMLGSKGQAVDSLHSTSLDHSAVAGAAFASTFANHDVDLFTGLHTHSADFLL